MSVDDEMLMAYLDGELDEIRRARIEQALGGDPALRRRLETQRRLRERLSAHYAPALDEPVPDRFRRMLELDVADLDSARAGARLRWPVWQSFAALAATLVLGVFVGQSLPDTGPVRSEGGAIYARGELAAALDTQLASAPPADARTRVGVTFARADGRFCRTFEAAALAGLACRADDKWQLVMTAASPPQADGEYRQAASGSALVLQAAQEMMAGEPLDAAAERRAQASGWRAAAD